MNKICLNENCNNVFKERGIKKYCSRSCKQKEKDRRLGNNNKRGKPYAIHKKKYCEKCGFIAEHKCQLDVDHIDGNSKNNEISNLQTLCANCHRIKTYLSQDWKNNNECIN